MAKKKPTLDLATLDVKSLKEFDGFAEAQNVLLTENKFIKVKDHKTYEAAKKAAHALLKGRTGLESQEKVVVKKLQEFRKQIGGATTSLIEITLGAEKKQKEEIRAYENRKAEEKRLKEEAEAKALEEIRNTILGIEETFIAMINSMTYETINKTSEALKTETEAIDGSVFKDLEELYDDTLILCRERFNTAKRGLTVAYEQAKREEELKAREEAMKKEAEERQKEDERRRKEDEEREAAAKKLVIENKQSIHAIMLLKAGYEETEDFVYSKNGNMISLLPFTDRGGELQYNLTNEEIREHIAYGLEIDCRIEELKPFEDLLPDEDLRSILALDKSDYQLELNQLIERQSAAKIENIEVVEAEVIVPEENKKLQAIEVQAKFEELKTAVNPDKETLLKVLDSFGLDFIPDEFETMEGAAFMQIVYDQFEECQAKLKEQINEKF